MKLMRVSKQFIVCRNYLNKLWQHYRTLRKLELYNKYNVYNELFQKQYILLKEKDRFALDPKGNPQLLDALSTECDYPYAQSTFKVYTPEIEQDIKDIVKLMPQSLNCILGSLRCRDQVPPLYMAFVNNKIPLPIIEFLIQRGAKPHAKLKINNMAWIPILKDYEAHIRVRPFSRFKAIQALVEKSDEKEEQEIFTAVQALFSPCEKK